MSSAILFRPQCVKVRIVLHLMLCACEKFEVAFSCLISCHVIEPSVLGHSALRVHLPFEIRFRFLLISIHGLSRNVLIHASRGCIQTSIYIPDATK